MPGAQLLGSACQRAEEGEGLLRAFVELTRLEPDEQAVRGRDRRGLRQPVKVVAERQDRVAVQLLPDGGDLPAHILRPPHLAVCIEVDAFVGE
ncbi:MULTISPECIES: hypothetical protein [unclassified Streptomyces]|uniref:Uncharacterized protein n=1 Tax=Streptomyces sp. NBC_00060 TaxID=2975636 RepID=A0AAU2HD86_9ACTN